MVQIGKSISCEGAQLFGKCYMTRLLKEVTASLAEFYGKLIAEEEKTFMWGVANRAVKE